MASAEFGVVATARHARALDRLCDAIALFSFFSLIARPFSLSRLCLCDLACSFFFPRSVPFAQVPLLYVKPCQTGFPTDSDAAFVAAAAGAPGSAVCGPHARQLLASEPAPPFLPSRSRLSTLFAWREPAAPDAASLGEPGRETSDEDVLSATLEELRAFEASLRGQGVGSSGLSLRALALVETAGGVLSPGPGGGAQADWLRALRAPAVLAGDGRLGGISATLSAIDSLALRGHELAAVTVPDARSDGRTAAAVAKALVPSMPGDAEAPTFRLPALPLRPAPGDSWEGLLDPLVLEWLEASEPSFDALLESLLVRHETRLAALAAMPSEALQKIWWPFTQHGLVGGERGVSVIESRVGEAMFLFGRGEDQGLGAIGLQPEGQGKNKEGGGTGTNARTAPSLGASNGAAASSPGDASSASLPVHLTSTFDGCAAWWTQGPDAPEQLRLARAVAAATARYGHVIFPEAVHLPALELSKRLLRVTGSSWASRAYFSDDGSTAMEIAFKMALRVWETRLRARGESPPPFPCVVNLTEAYHGDTLGAVDAVAPSPYNGPRQTPWSQSRGVFVDPPTLQMERGRWTLRLGQGLLLDYGDQRWGAQDNDGGNETARSVSPPEGLALEVSKTFPAWPGAAAAADAATSATIGPHSSRASVPQTALAASDLTFGSLEEALAAGRASPALAALYDAAAEALFSTRTAQAAPAALVMEPLVQGAGGMRLVDPEYARALARAARRHGVPVVLDEIFAGLYRLGVPSAGLALGIEPDAAAFGKLLTGGTVPLAITLASEEAFAAFYDENDKLEALLHGHSYTAHPAGCAAACEALRALEDNPNLQEASAGRSVGTTASEGSAGREPTNASPMRTLRALWPEETLVELSSHAKVTRVTCIGTVLAVELAAGKGQGYASGAATAVCKLLAQRDVFARPLGAVAYIMVSPLTNPDTCKRLAQAMFWAVDQS